MHVGLALRRLRLESGSSMRDLARRLGVSSAYLSRLEHGLDAEPTPERLRVFARELGVPSALLLELGHRLGPWVGRYVEQSPAAASLFLALVRRELAPDQLAEVRRFVETRWPLAVDRATLAPLLGPLLSAERIVHGVRGATLEDVLELAAARLLEGAPNEGAGELAATLQDHHQRIGSGVGGGVLVPVVRWAHPSIATLVVLDDPLQVQTPDEVAARVVVAAAFRTDEPHGLAYIAQAARLASRGLVDALADVHDASTILSVIDALETP